VRHRDAGGVDRVLLQHRALWSHHGGTWGIPGGARHLGETAEEAARREAAEESDLDVTAVPAGACYVDDHGGWSYTTVVVWVPERAPVAVRGGESVELTWWRTADLGEAELHPGFAATWEHVRTL
jgi:ADP-ribose pyrophosphatase YjhB (NUDIX family)